MVKKFISILVMSILGFIMIISSYAKSDITATKYRNTYQEDFSEVKILLNKLSCNKTNAKIKAIYRITNDGKIKIGKQEALRLLKQNNKDLMRDCLNKTNIDFRFNSMKLLQTFLYNYYDYKYIKLSTSVASFPFEGGRISQYIYNYTSSPIQRTLSSHTSVSWGCSISLSSSMKAAISATLGSSWSKTVSFSDASTITIPPGYMSWAEFVPIKNVTRGTMQYRYYNPWPFYSVIYEENCEVDYARELSSGQADGILFFMEEEI